jgi:hypothetical protein
MHVDLSDFHSKLTKYAMDGPQLCSQRLSRALITKIAGSGSAE